MATARCPSIAKEKITKALNHQTHVKHSSDSKTKNLNFLTLKWFWTPMDWSSQTLRCNNPTIKIRKDLPRPWSSKRRDGAMSFKSWANPKPAHRKLREGEIRRTLQVANDKAAKCSKQTSCWETICCRESRRLSAETHHFDPFCSGSWRQKPADSRVDYSTCRVCRRIDGDQRPQQF